MFRCMIVIFMNLEKPKMIYNLEHMEYLLV
jgi:hypothetical protein